MLPSSGAAAGSDCPPAPSPQALRRNAQRSGRVGTGVVLGQRDADLRIGDAERLASAGVGLGL
jgi:hypothetical protein